MSSKRMFSEKIVCSDAFMDMPASTQALYFHLGMKVDDDGFVNPRTIMRMIGASEDELKVLVGKKFVLPFRNGVVVLKHHRINNNWDKYNCKRTVYTEELKTLFIKENKAYTLDKSQGKTVWLQSGYSLKADRKKSLEQNRIEENRIEENNKQEQATAGPSFEKEKAPAKVEQKVQEIPYTQDFKTFYNLYPKKIGKVGAFKKWEVVIKKTSPQVIIKALENQIKNKHFDENPKFIKHPEVWLNKGCWEDEVKNAYSVPERKYSAPPKHDEYTPEELEKNRQTLAKMRRELFGG